MPNRRDFLRKIAGASAGMLLLGSECGFAQSAQSATPLSVEKLCWASAASRRWTCTLTLPCRKLPSCLKVLRSNDAVAVGIPWILNAERLVRMDHDGVDVHAASINPFWYTSTDRELMRSLMDLQNEKLAAQCKSFPDRFVAYAAVALQFPDLAAENLEAGVKRWGLKGGAIGTSVVGEDLSSPKYDPFGPRRRNWIR